MGGGFKKDQVSCDVKLIVCKDNHHPTVTMSQMCFGQIMQIPHADPDDKGNQK